MVRWVTISPFSPRLSPRLSSPQLSSFSLERVFVSVPFPLSLRSMSSPVLLPTTVKNLYTFLAGPNGQVQRRVRRAVCSLFDEGRRFSVSPSVLPPPSYCRLLPRHFLHRTFAGVFSLSSRKKFFYNFWIVLFRPSPFFQPRAGRSPRVGFTPPASAALLTASHVCFLLSRFHLVQPFLRCLALPLLSLSFRRRLCFLFWQIVSGAETGAVLIK